MELITMQDPTINTTPTATNGAPSDGHADQVASSRLKRRRIDCGGRAELEERRKTTTEQTRTANDGRRAKDPTV